MRTSLQLFFGNVKGECCVQCLPHHVWKGWGEMNKNKYWSPNGQQESFKNVFLVYNSGKSSSLCHLVERNDKPPVKATVNICRMGAGYFAAKKNIYPACWLTPAPKAEALRPAAVGRVSSSRWLLGLSAAMEYASDLFWSCWSLAHAYWATGRCLVHLWDFLYYLILMYFNINLNGHMQLTATTLYGTGW